MNSEIIGGNRVQVNEARGLSADVRDHLNGLATLPMVGKADPLNAAVAGGVLMYAWLWADQSREPARSVAAAAQKAIYRNLTGLEDLSGLPFLHRSRLDR